MREEKSSDSRHWQQFSVFEDSADFSGAALLKDEGAADLGDEEPLSPAGKFALACWGRFFVLIREKAREELMQAGYSDRSCESTFAELVVKVRTLHEDVQIWPEWEQRHEPLLNSLKTRPSEILSDISNIVNPGKVKDQKPEMFSRWRRFMIQPNSKRKLLWDLMGMMCLCWDFVTIPLSVFNIQDNYLLLVVAYTMTVFWSVDMVFSFFVGFYHKGQIEMRPIEIWKRYIKSWFFADLALVVTDWLILILQHMYSDYDVAGYMRIGRTWRIVRILRMVRLVRLAKASRIFEELTDLIRSEIMQTVLTISKLVGGIALIAHMVACAWYWVGTLGFEENWLMFIFPQNEILDTSQTMYAYTTALHWSLTQFTPASMEVVPKNSYERIFALCTIMLALVVFSSFVSSITAAMTHLRMIKMKQTKMQAAVRKYILDNYISSELALQVHRFARMHQQKTKRVLMSDLTFVRFMPEKLRIRLHVEAYMPRLVRHPLFERLSLVDQTGVVAVCHTAVGEHSLLAGEELFNYGDPCNRMYLALFGDLHYYYHTLSGDTVMDIRGNESEHSRISESVLWTHWEHRGRLVASTSSFLLTLSSPKFRGVVKGRPLMCGPACLYAREYIKELLRACGGRKQFMLDIWDDGQALEGLAQEAFMQTGMCPAPTENSRGLFRTMGSLKGRLKRKWSADTL